LTTNYLFENHPIRANVLLSSLKTLKLTLDEEGFSRFNFPLLPGILPASLKVLHFGEYFNQPITKDVLPSSLESLIFSEYSKFNFPLLLLQLVDHNFY
jgi:hypothetical protein